MCGIVGILGFGDKKLVRKMNNILVHRGPDDCGYYSDKNIELGHRRLAIIDLSKAGKQPMSNEDETLWIVFNGEIYNFANLRQELEEKGHKFKSDSDTEVIIHSYEEYGSSCLEKFNGIFAFAIYDSKKKELFIARDRVGVKPLYYYQEGKKLLFASEIKAILEYPEIKREIDLEGFYSYFISGSYSPAPLTMIKNVKQLPPGYFGVYKDNKLKLEKYWDLNFTKSGEINWEKELEKRFYSSVKAQMISDVPIGAYLSGGIDSSSIVAGMSRYSDKVRTFSVGFDSGEVINELEYARQVSQKFSTEHKEIVVGQEGVKIIPELVWHQDAPLTAMAVVPLHYMAKEASKSVKVILNGNGSDELLGGYRQQLILKVLNEKYFIKRIYKNKLNSSLLNSLSKSSLVPEKGKRGARYLKNILDSENDFCEEYLQVVNQNLNNIKNKKIFSENLKQDKFDYKKYFDYSSREYDAVQNATKMDFKLLLANNFLLSDDKISMAHSIESRVPFLDNEMLDFASILPSKYKINFFEKKFLLRKTMKNILPKEVIKRKKYGFTAPLRYWYNEYLYDVACQLLDSKEIKKQDLFSERYTARLLKGSKESNEKINIITGILSFQIWHKIFIEGEKVRI
ncbi:MAG: asparagine synthase (glutamine-hydrolyzing) [archaeon]